MDFLQGDNQMSTFAKMTGGRWFSPRFEAELPEDFREIAAAVRNQYTITYRPTNTKRDGTYRKLKVELVQTGHGQTADRERSERQRLKYQVLTREGYTAKHEVSSFSVSACLNRTACRKPGVRQTHLAVMNGRIAGAGYSPALRKPGSQILDLVAGLGFSQLQGRGVAPGD